MKKRFWLLAGSGLLVIRGPVADARLAALARAWQSGVGVFC
jgi:hypothetical protein